MQLAQNLLTCVIHLCFQGQTIWQKSIKNSCNADQKSPLSAVAINPVETGEELGYWGSLSIQP